MGFIYDISEWDASLGGVIAPVGNVFKKGGTSGTGLDKNDFRWNVFPVPINTIEGHAMVYCYFDRENNAFSGSGWDNVIDKFDQLNALKTDPTKFRPVGQKPTNSGYTKRLHDPSLLYNDPW